MRSPSSLSAVWTAGRAETRAWYSVRVGQRLRSMCTILVQLRTVNRYASAIEKLSPVRYCLPLSCCVR